MKHLSSLTTFFVVFLFVVYLGVFAGLKVNSFIAGKKLVSVTAVPVASVTAQPTPIPSVIIAQVPQAKAQVQGVTSQVAPVVPPPATPATTTITSSPTDPPAPVVDTSTPPPVDTPPAPPPPPPSEPPPSNRCIITLSGSQYDVTEYRNMHSGGDVFQCGTDMTASFLSRHPASFLSKMSQYKV